MVKEFKEFAMRGNVLDMAVGVIIGAAFGKIVSSVVADILMPPIGVLLGKVDFSNTLIDFVIVAFVIFLVVRQVNRMRNEPVPPTPTTKACPYCLSTIALKATRCPQCTSQVEAA